jgi:uncharacterized protein (TIGR03000 family)
MYTAVLMLALTSGADAADFGRRGGCYGCNGCNGYYGGYSGYCHGCSGYYGGCHGCHGCYGGYGGCYAVYRYGYASPAYYAFYRPGNDVYVYGGIEPGYGIESRRSFYPPAENLTMIRVMLSNPEAQVWFNGAEMSQRGFERMFNTPILPNGNYNYTVKAKWMDDGRVVEQERRVTFQPGQHLTVDFRTSPPEVVNPPKTPDKPLPKDELKVPKDKGSSENR